MITISLCMIVKNEEETIKKCLSSVNNIVDEIIIIDTGSIDHTKEIASNFTDKIYNFLWIDDFSAARNFSYSKATMDYILWLDADDLVLPEDNIRFMALKESLDPDIDCVMMKYNTGFDSPGNVNFSYYRERLSKRNRNFKWQEPVHEYLQIGGKIINSEICITHTKKHRKPSTRNIDIYEHILSQGNFLSARGSYYYARELKDNRRYEEAIQQFHRFLDSNQGWVEDNIAACGELGKCYLMVENQEKALASMFCSFAYDIPRAEICCQIGYYFKDQCNYKSAIFWFKLILTLEKPKESLGFLSHDCWDYIPSIELAACYSALNDYEKSEYFNNLAEKYKPDSQSVLYNKNWFAFHKTKSSNKNEE